MITVYDMARNDRYIMFLLPHTKFLHVKKYYLEGNRWFSPGSKNPFLLDKNSRPSKPLRAELVPICQTEMPYRQPLFIYGHKKIPDHATPDSLCMAYYDSMFVFCNLTKRQ